jgi:hypothetical protein
LLHALGGAALGGNGSGIGRPRNVCFSAGLPPRRQALRSGQQRFRNSSACDVSP